MARKGYIYGIYDLNACRAKIGHTGNKYGIVEEATRAAEHTLGRVING